MKNKTTLIAAVLGILLVGTSVLVYTVIAGKKAAPVAPQQDVVEVLPDVDKSITVTVEKSSSAANTVVVQAKGLASKMTSIGYELTYESQGLIKGVNSGSSDIDVSGKDTFERDIYLGTCSRNVCKADAGVTKVSVVLKFTDTAGKKSQFSKDFEL
jgi:hypothetical protein